MKIKRSKIYKGVNSSFEIMQLEGLFAIYAGVLIFSIFIITVLLCLFIPYKVIAIIVMLSILFAGLYIIVYLNKHSSIKEIKLYLGKKKNSNYLKGS